MPTVLDVKEDIVRVRRDFIRQEEVTPRAQFWNEACARCLVKDTVVQASPVPSVRPVGSIRPIGSVGSIRPARPASRSKGDREDRDGANSSNRTKATEFHGAASARQTT